MRRLPPLETLRVFEAAARHLSFKAAGDELAVTASAVSHRIAALEEDIGTALFVRHVRRIELTPDGERLSRSLRRALGDIRRAVAAVDRRENVRLRIAALPSHVVRWIAPRLHRFQAVHPTIELQIVAETAVVDLTLGGYDVALRFGNGDYPQLHAEDLMGDVSVAIASPRYLDANGPVARPSDLLRLARILDVTAEDDGSGVNWRTWFAHFGLPMDDIDKGARFNGAAITIEAAAGGLGVAIVRGSLAVDDVRSGRLVQVLPTELPTRWRHYVLTLPDAADWPPLRAFIDWLHEEARLAGA